MNSNYPAAVIWDMDGTLVDTAELHFQAWVVLARELNKPFTRADFAATFGWRNPEIIPKLFGKHYTEQQIQELGDRKETLYREQAKKGVMLLPGARTLLEGLAAAGFGQGIGSSAPRANLELILQLTETTQFFTAVVSMEDTQRGKPDPDVFLRVAAKLNVPPERCLVIEDAPAGIQAARAGGMRSIAVTYVPHHDPQTLRDAGADLIVPSLEQVSVGIISGLLGEPGQIGLHSNTGFWYFSGRRPVMDYNSLWRNWKPWEFIPTQFNLGVALTRGQVDQGHGDKPALHWENAAGQSKTFTYRQLDAASNRCAGSLRKLGVKAGDRVFLRLPNLPEFYIAALAVAKLGGVFIPSSTQFREAEISYRLNDSEAVAAITTPRLFPEIDRVRNDCPALQNVVIVPEDGARVTSDCVHFNRLLDDASEYFVPAASCSDDLAFIAYTSGTTGDPKGVVHHQRYPIAYESLVRYWHDYRPDDVVACPSELGWLLPVASTFLYALSRGLTVVLYDGQGAKFDPFRWFKLIEKYHISNFTAPPTTYRMLMAQADAARQHDLSSWRHGVSAGEPLPADTLAAIRKTFGITLLDGIGMTECMVYCFNMVGAALKEGSCGRPGPGTVIELLDDDLVPVQAGQEGVLCVRRDSHPGMMKEYWHKPERTAEVFRGPWYYTGDVLARDEDGYFWFKGRNDDVIKASGYRISPFEVESCLVCHPAVLEAAAVESPDPIRGKVVKAFVVLRPGFEPAACLQSQIQEFAKTHMAGYKYPRKLEFVPALPKTVSGKIRRKELREREKMVSR